MIFKQDLEMSLPLDVGSRPALFYASDFGAAPANHILDFETRLTGSEDSIAGALRIYRPSEAVASDIAFLTCRARFSYHVCGPKNESLSLSHGGHDEIQ